MLDDELVVRVLGPVQLCTRHGHVVQLPSASQRRLLAALALRAPSPARAEWLCGLLDITPGALRTSVARLRRVLGVELLHTSVTGYRLDARVDAQIVADELRSANGDPATIIRALDRWGGRAFEEFAEEPWAVAESTRLTEMRSGALEDLALSLITARRARDAIIVLRPHVIEHPYRDNPRGLLMRALACGGRQTEAMREYQLYRGLLAENVGTEPSVELRRIDQRVAQGWDGVSSDHAPSEALPTIATVQRSVRIVRDMPTSAVAFVGREMEQDVLAGAAERAVGGEASAVLITGPAGIGKTSLIASFAREHHATIGMHVLYGRCDESVTAPFEPFRGLLARLVELVDDELLDAHTAACGGDLLRLLPQLRMRVSTTASLAIDEITARHLLFEAIVDLVRRASTATPLLIILDDLHWAEPTALQLLRFLISNVGGFPVLFVASFRSVADAPDDHLRETVADLARGDVVRIDLDGFGREELADLVRVRVPSAVGRDVSTVVDRLGDESAGNPLFAEHLLRHWVDSAQLTIVEARVTVSPEPIAEVPSTLRDLVWRGVSGLGQAAGPVLSAAAVLGVQFDERHLAAMTDIDRHDLARLLDRAVAVGVLADHPSSAGTMRFTHALVARSLEADLGKRARTTLHAKAFESLLRAHASSRAELPGRLARHAALGDRLDDALLWAKAAGEHALAALAPDEAAEWFRTAYEHATILHRADPERADLLVRWGQAAHRAGHSEALETLRRGAELAEHSGADFVLVRAALATDRGTVTYGAFAPIQLAIVEAAARKVGHDDVQNRVRIDAMLAQCLVGTGEHARRTALALQVLDMARSSTDGTLLARIAPAALFALWAPGTIALRMEVAAEAAAISDEAGDPGLAFGVHVAAFDVAVCAGDAAAIRLHAGRVHAIAEEIGEPHMQFIAGLVDGFIATMAGRFAEAETIITDTFNLGERIGESDAFQLFAVQYFMVGTFAGKHAEMLPLVQMAIDGDDALASTFRTAHAILSCEVGERDGPRAHLQMAIERGLDVIPLDMVRTTSVIGLAIVADELDDVVAAAWLYPEISRFASEVSFNGVVAQGPASAYAGKLASLLGAHADAERYLLDALGVAEACGWEYHRATTLIGLAKNRLRRDGRLDERGQSWLATAEQLCATHGITSWAKRAVELRVAATTT